MKSQNSIKIHMDNNEKNTVIIPISDDVNMRERKRNGIVKTNIILKILEMNVQKKQLIIVM